MNPQRDVSDKALAKVLGQEIRREREARGWTRAELAEQLPSGIGERTLLSYEHGIRALSVVRLVEICRALGAATGELLDRALEKARDLRAFSLRVDLRALLRDHGPEFSAVHTWARNRLDDNPTPEVHLTPATVREMAAIIGLSHIDLADYLFKFVSDDLPMG